MSVIPSLIQTLSKIYPKAKRWLHRFHGGVFPQYNKGLSANQPIRSPYLPKRLILPLHQKVGQRAELLVQVGERVQKNQLIAQSAKDPETNLVVPIHAPTSGVIEAIESHPLAHPSGLMDEAIILVPDRLNQAIDNVLERDLSQPVETPDELKNILLKAGIIGMGGAGFPTYAKIPSQPGQIKTLLINGAECEPFITCDDVLMQQRADDIIQGALITAKALGASEVICGIETNKPQAIQAMQRAANNTIVSIKTVQTVYPMGGQKQLTLELTGIETPHKKHAVDLGLLMMNVATFRAIYRAVQYGEPLTSRLLTVTGLGLNDAFNIEALIGTPFDELAELANPKVELNYPLIMGGPMMGFKLLNNQAPIGKTTNCILANPPEPADMQMPCIRCGQCMEACPVSLLPQQMYFHAQAHEFDKVEKLNVFDCIECGCCSFVCPSHIPLVQYYRHSKSEIRAIKAEEQAVELAKERHEFKLARIEREKQEREARLKAKKEAVKKQAAQAANKNTDQASTGAKKPAAAAAAARAAAARKAAKNTAAEGENKAIPSARLKAIEAAKKRAAGSSQDKTASKASPQEAAKKAAAMAAAKKRAAKATQSDATSTDSPVEKKDPKQAARQAVMVAAKKRAAKAAQPDTASTDSPVDKKDPKQAARQAAMAAAKKRAAKKRAAKAAQPDTAPTDSPVEKKDPKQAARQAAMAAAKRAAEKRAQKQQGTSNAPSVQDTNQAETSTESSLTHDAKVDKKALAKHAAKKAAQAAAAKRKQASTENHKEQEATEAVAPQMPEVTAEQVTLETTQDVENKAEKRRRAMQAAKERAAKRKTNTDSSKEDLS